MCFDFSIWNYGNIVVKREEQRIKAFRMLVNERKVSSKYLPLEGESREGV